MSGTSADGIDVAIVDITARRVELLAFGMFPYPRQVRREIFRLFDPRQGGSGLVSAMNFAVGECFAEALVRWRGGIGLGCDRST